jgi:hypothetical protein
VRKNGKNISATFSNKSIVGTPISMASGRVLIRFGCISRVTGMTHTKTAANPSGPPPSGTFEGEGLLVVRGRARHFAGSDFAVIVHRIGLFFAGIFDGVSLCVQGIFLGFGRGLVGRVFQRVSLGFSLVFDLVGLLGLASAKADKADAGNAGENQFTHVSLHYPVSCTMHERHYGWVGRWLQSLVKIFGGWRWDLPEHALPSQSTPKLLKSVPDWPWKSCFDIIAAAQ